MDSKTNIQYTIPGQDLIVLGFTTRHPLWVILCRLPEKGRKEVEQMKERDFFLFGFYGPFKNISFISSRSFMEGGRKPENPGKNHLTIRKQNLAFQHVIRARLEPQQ